MRRLVDEAGLAGEIEVDGAGTGSWHVGEPPDPRAVEAAARRDIRLAGTARQVDPSDFEAFDLIVAVDEENLERLQKVAPPGADAQLRMLDARDVPDPYYGGPDGFDLVLDQIITACSRLLDELRQD